jgi:hypothetical protein
MTDAKYVNASLPATLQYHGHSVECVTLQEAVIALHALPDGDREKASIRHDGQIYTAQEIDRLHHGPKPKWCCRQ